MSKQSERIWEITALKRNNGGKKVLKTEVLLLQRLILRLYFCWPLMGTRGGLRYVYIFVKKCILISVCLTAKYAVIILSISKFGNNYIDLTEESKGLIN